LYEIQQQQQIKTTTKLIQTFPQEHSSDYSITCLLQINPNTLVSSSWSASPSDNVIVIWSKSKSSSLYEPLQRITQKETGEGIESLVLITQKKEEEEEFASCSDHSIIIWRRGKGEFQIKQKITNVQGVSRLLYISLTNELISGSHSSSLLQIWSPSSSSSSSSSDFVKRQKIETSSGIYSLCHLNRNNDSRRVEFASGHYNGQIMIWSKQINESQYSSSIRTLQPFNDNHIVYDLIFIHEFNFLIACSYQENKIVIYKGEEEKEEELEHEGVYRLITMSNGQFASGGGNLNIWTPSSSSSS
jgi:hypothetical protein